MSDSNPDDVLYDFAPEASPAPQTRLKPQVLKTDAPAVLAYRVAKDDQPPPLEAEAIKNIYLPLGLLVGGIVVDVLASIIWTHQVTGAFAELVVDLTLGTAVMLAAMLLAARLRGIDLGKIPVAALKLAAISIAPPAAMQFFLPIMRFIPLGGIVCWVIEFILFFALLGALFDLDESDTWYCVWTIFFTRLGIYLILRMVFQA